MRSLRPPGLSRRRVRLLGVKENPTKEEGRLPCETRSLKGGAFLAPSE